MPGLPLADVRVIEFCNVAAGPFCGMLLADMGADVIKIEKPQGDDLRHWPPITDGFSENFASLNRNKRSVVLDLKNPEHRERAFALCASADVVLENNRPGVMDRLGLGHAQLSAANPKLVYCSISAYGQSGPYAQQGGFDLTIQGISGIMSVTGEPGGAPVKCGVPVSDFSAGLYGAFSIVSALKQARESGEGAHVDISMLGASLGIAALQTSELFGSGNDPRPLGSAHPRNAPYQAFKARDGYFVMAAGNDRLWRGVCEALARKDLAADPRFASTALRASNQTALKDLLEAQFADHDCAELIERFSAVGVPCGPINGYGAALEHPQVQHFGWVQPLTLPGGHQTRTFASPIVINGESAPIRRPPPTLGEHNAELERKLDARPGTDDP
ncbi:MAG: CoA transferase [Gammaproteobacteria bacterium]|nr:CoA transferase [Gammaproteobacteria bacterium]